MDKQLPSALQTLLTRRPQNSLWSQISKMLTLTEILKLLVQIILLCISEIWLSVSLPACMIVVYIVQRVYLRTSKQLRLLELESRARVFSSFLESVRTSVRWLWAEQLISNVSGRGSRNHTVVWLVQNRNRKQHPLCRRLPASRIPSLVSPEMAQYRPRSSSCSCCNKRCCYSCSISGASQRRTSRNCA